MGVWKFHPSIVPDWRATLVLNWSVTALRCFYFPISPGISSLLIKHFGLTHQPPVSAPWPAPSPGGPLCSVGVLLLVKHCSSKKNERWDCSMAAGNIHLLLFTFCSYPYAQHSTKVISRFFWFRVWKVILALNENYVDLRNTYATSNERKVTLLNKGPVQKGASRRGT